MKTGVICLLSLLLLGMTLPAHAGEYSIQLCASTRQNTAEKITSRLNKAGVSANWLECKTAKGRIFRIRSGWFDDREYAEDYLKRLNPRLPEEFRSDALVVRSCESGCAVPPRTRNLEAKIHSLWFDKNRFDDAQKHISSMPKRDLFLARRSAFCDPDFQNGKTRWAAVQTRNYLQLRARLADALGELLPDQVLTGRLGECLGGGSSAVSYVFISDSGEKLELSFTAATSGPWYEVGKGDKIKVYLEGDASPIKVEVLERGDM